METAEQWERLERVLVVVSAVFFSVLLVLLFFRVSYLPTNDGPQHLFAEYVHNHIDDGVQGYRRHFVRNEPLTNLAFHWIFSPLEPRVGWRVSQQIALIVMGLLWGWGTVALFASLRRERQLVGLLGFVLATQWSLYMGFFSFLLAGGLALFVLALAMDVSSWNLVRRIAIAAAWFVLALGHLFVAEVVGVVLGLLVLAHEEGWRARLRGLFLLGVMSLPVLAIALLSALTMTELAGLEGAAQSSEWLPWSTRLFTFVRCVVVGPWWRTLPVLGLCALSFGWALDRWKKGSLSSQEKALLLTGVFFVLAYFSLPLHTQTWDFLSTRFPPFAVVFLLAVLPAEKITSAMRVRLLAVLVCFVTAGFLWTDRMHQARVAELSDALEAMRVPLRRSGWRMPVVTLKTAGADGEQDDPYLPYWSPTFNLPVLFALEQGGMLVEVFASVPTLHSIMHRTDGAQRPTYLFRSSMLGIGGSRMGPNTFFRALTDVARHGTNYADVIVYAPNHVQQALLRRGYRADFQRGRMLLAHFEGCPSRVRLASSAGTNATLEWGWIPSSTAAQTIAVEPASDREIPLRTPCGPVWIRVRESNAPFRNYECEGATGPGGFVLSGANTVITCR